MFGDLDWPANASRRFVSISGASGLLFLLVQYLFLCHFNCSLPVTFYVSRLLWLWLWMWLWFISTTNSRCYCNVILHHHHHHRHRHHTRSGWPGREVGWGPPALNGSRSRDPPRSSRRCSCSLDPRRCWSVHFHWHLYVISPHVTSLVSC